MYSDEELKHSIPPSDQSAERGVLGSILRDNATFADAAQEIVATDFYLYAHQLIWLVIADLSQSNAPIDAVTVADRVNAKGWTSDIGGNSYLIDLWNSAPSAANAQFYAKIVKEKSIRRAIISAGMAMQRLASEDRMESEEIISRVSESIFELSLGSRSKTTSWPVAVAEALAVLDRRSGKTTDGQIEEGLKTGWPRFDKLTGGFHKRELVVVGARPSVGKTMVALNIIDAVAAEGGRVFFASLEQGTIEVVHRILAMKSGVSSHRFRTGQFDADDDRKTTDAISATRDYRIDINAGSGQSLMQVLTDSRRLKMRSGLDLVVIDYLGLLDGERRRHGTRAEEVGLLTRGAKRLAKDLDVAVLLLAQLNRGIDSRVDKRPRLSDLRESGDIEQDADTVLMLHKPEERDDRRENDKLHIQVEKQRNGPCGTIEMVHYKRTFVVKEDSGM